MRKINKIIIHCSATPENRYFSAADIKRWHLQRGFITIGYHKVVLLDGTVEDGRPIEHAGAHCLGHNADSIGICYIGGLDADGKKPKDTRTTAQKKALRLLINDLRHRFGSIPVYGHNRLTCKRFPLPHICCQRSQMLVLLNPSDHMGICRGL